MRLARLQTLGHLEAYITLSEESTDPGNCSRTHGPQPSHQSPLTSSEQESACRSLEFLAASANRCLQNEKPAHAGIAVSLQELTRTQETARVEHATSTHSLTKKDLAAAVLVMCCDLPTSHIKLQPWRLLAPNVACFCCSAHSMQFGVLCLKHSDMIGTCLLVLTSGLNTAPVLPHNCQSAERRISGYGNSCAFKPFILQCVCQHQQCSMNSRMSGLLAAFDMQALTHWRQLLALRMFSFVSQNWCPHSYLSNRQS